MTHHTAGHAAAVGGPATGPTTMETSSIALVA